MKTFLTIAALLGLLLTSVVLGYQVWMELEEVELTWHGWVAMTLGIVFTLLVGAGLMALVFFSHRHGYDDRANRPDD